MHDGAVVLAVHAFSAIGGVRKGFQIFHIHRPCRFGLLREDIQQLNKQASDPAGGSLRL